MADGPLRGVNLGGWLLLEKWLTPSLFAGTDAEDEYGFMRTPGAAEKLRRHRAEFLKEADFAWIAEHGLDLVRIPVGHWVFGEEDRSADEPELLGAIKELDWAMEMAAKYGLLVLLDLHGAPGSQNGRDHSGLSGKRNWYARQDFRDRTVDVLERLARRYAAADHLWGIELLNEPMDPRLWTLIKFYRRAYASLITILRPGTRIIFSDGFVPWLTRGAIRPVPDYPVIMDCHLYQCFYPWDQRNSIPHHLRKARHSRAKLIKWLSRRHPVIVGEWSVALPGRTIAGLGPDQITALRRDYAEAQQQGYAGAVAWTFWNYTAEERNEWNYRALVEDGHFIPL
ncbi:glycoside hydrolase family 5 protein [Microlunatus speluncae]|uniref:glycoside hydrolase family 5 protein n=1 Tax=Microlunatus speluncae TaxID=2594267 RepID=UPI00126676B9|nr:cellulase family glycosylhydrolase [Microlunatus speluncae]